MGDMRDRWRVIKKWTEDQAAEKKGTWVSVYNDPKALRALLKKFVSGLGPNLDKVEAAYKANKGADVQKYASAALPIAKNYLHEVEDSASKHHGTDFSRVEEHLTKLVENLETLKAKGMLAPAHLVE